jgi:putative PEP-CTERM system TPR-repeat lipoprotein
MMNKQTELPSSMQSSSKVHSRRHGWLLAAVLLLSGMSLAVSAADVEELVAKAGQYLKEGELRSAVIQLKNALRENPNHAEARLLLGDIYLRAGKGVAAEKEIRRARSLGIAEERWLIPLGKAYLQQGRYSDLINEIVPRQSHDPVIKAQALALHGMAYLAEKQYGKALGKADEALAEDPNSVDALLLKARLAMVAKDLDEVRKLIDLALQNDANRTDAWVLKGEVSRVQGDLEGAKRAFSAAIAMEPHQFGARMGRAATLMALGKDEEAEADIKEVMKLQPNHPLANFLTAVGEFRRGDTAAAQERLLQILRLVPDHLPSHLLLGAVYYGENQFEVAENHLVVYLRDNPDHLPAAKLLAAVQMKLKRPGDAVTLLERMLEKHPEDAQLMALLGSAYLQNKDYERGSELLEKAAQLQPDRAAIHAQLALGKLATGDLTSAVDELQNAVGLGQGLVQADILLVMVHLQNQKIDEALEVARRLVEKSPDNPVAHNLLGGTYLAKGDMDKARQAFATALKLQPGFINAEMNLAQIEIREGKDRAAEQRYRRILAKHEGHLGALMGLARLKEKQGKMEEAMDWVRQARSKNPSAIQPALILIDYYRSKNDHLKAVGQARELLTTHPDNPLVIRTMGVALTGARQFGSALPYFKKLVDMQPDSVEANFLLAQALIRTEDYDEARRMLDRTLRLSPGHAGALVALAELWIRADDPSRALEAIKVLQEKHEKSAIGYHMEGDVQFRRKAYGQAIAAYEKAMKLNPSAALAGAIHRTYMRMGDEKNAFKVLNDWLRNHPSDTATRLMLALAYHEKNRVDDAIREYEKVIAVDTKNVVVLNNLAWLYHDKKDPRALDFARKAYDLAPERPEITDTLGWLMFLNGDRRRGLPLLQESVARAPQMSDIRYHLAYALHETGRDKEALVQLKRVLQTDKDFAEREQAEALFRKLGGNDS